jgi:hypothetical protein
MSAGAAQRLNCSRWPRSSSAIMRASVILACVLPLIVMTGIIRGFGPLALPQIIWDACLSIWNTLRFLSPWIVPHWFNHVLFWLVGRCVGLVFQALNLLFFLWESGFDLIMFVLGQQPSAAGASIAQYVAHAFQASGISVLIQIICNEFSRVPQVLEDYFASFDHFGNVLAVAALIAVLVEDIYIYRRPNNLFRTSSVFFFLVFGCFDAVVFAILIFAILLPILLIFACLALASLAVHRLRPSIRPKHSAPCMALLVAVYVTRQKHHRSNIAMFSLPNTVTCIATRTLLTTGLCLSYP